MPLQAIVREAIRNSMRTRGYGGLERVRDRRGRYDRTHLMSASTLKAREKKRKHREHGRRYRARMRAEAPARARAAELAELRLWRWGADGVIARDVGEGRLVDVVRVDDSGHGVERVGQCDVEQVRALTRRAIGAGELVADDRWLVFAELD